MINCRRSMLPSCSAAQRLSSDEGVEESNLMASDGFDQHHLQFGGDCEQIFKPFTANKKRFESLRWRGNVGAHARQFGSERY